MIIPKGAENKYTAELMIDFVYDVDRAARLANFIYYISPGQGRRARRSRRSIPRPPTNPLLFPPADVVAKQIPQPAWDEETETGHQRALRQPVRRLSDPDLPARRRRSDDQPAARAPPAHPAAARAVPAAGAGAASG